MLIRFLKKHPAEEMTAAGIIRRFMKKMYYYDKHNKIQYLFYTKSI